MFSFSSYLPYKFSDVQLFAKHKCLAQPSYSPLLHESNIFTYNMEKYILTYPLLKKISCNRQILPFLHYVFYCLLLRRGSVFACQWAQASKYHQEDTWPDKAIAACKEATQPNKGVSRLPSQFMQVNYRKLAHDYISLGSVEKTEVLSPTFSYPTCTIQLLPQTGTPEVPCWVDSVCSGSRKLIPQKKSSFSIRLAS